VWRREVNTSHIRIRDSGHLIPQAKPDDLGEWTISPPSSSVSSDYQVKGKEIASYVMDKYSGSGRIAARL